MNSTYTTFDINSFSEALEPFRNDLVGIAVESTPNWYWFVDGLTDAGYKMHLTNTFKSKQYDGLKYSDDRHDARWLARMLCLGILPRVISTLARTAPGETCFAGELFWSAAARHRYCLLSPFVLSME